jgi:putative transferase (TIGR04331 family)
MEEITSTKVKLLVTTGLRETWGKLHDVTFIGEWCKSYPSPAGLKKINHQTVPFHWSDRKKLQKDYKYIQSLNERILEELVIKLNKHHQINKSTNYWRIILGPWLFLFTPVLFDRWEGIRISIQNYDLDETFILSLNEEEGIPDDYDDLNYLSNDDVWNHSIFSHILVNYFQKKIKLTTIPFKTETDIYNRIQRNKSSFRSKILFFADKLISLLYKTQKVVILDGYFNKISLFKMLINLNQIPRFNSVFKEKIKYTRNFDGVRQDKLNINAKDNFEKFIESYLFSMIPVAYLESYFFLSKKAKSINQNPKIIFTAISHYNNELFKVWASSQVENNSKLFITEHGGAIPYKFSLMTEHEAKIADKKIVWHKKIDINQVQLSPTKVIRRRFDSTSRSVILLIGLESPKYSYFVQSGPVSSLVLDDFESNISLVNLLSSDALINLKVRPALDQGWNLRLRYSDELGIDKISNHGAIDEDIKNSKLVVCTYPSTTFLEAMLSNTPTVLVYSKEVWELRPEFGELLKRLKKVKIVFIDSESAANHINDISYDPRIWWDNYETLEARKYFNNQCGAVSENWLKEWSDFFHFELNN